MNVISPESKMRPRGVRRFRLRRGRRAGGRAVTDRFDWILAVPPECPNCEHVPMKFVRRREYVTKSDAAEYRCPECGTRKVTRESEERARGMAELEARSDEEAER
jgi:predicted RNA-binding Zn-ribbon protein involved in translation (DUF1610 family)